MEPLLSVEEAARVLGLSPWTIRLKIRQKSILPVRLGRRVLLEPCELEKYVARCKSVPTDSMVGQIPTDPEECHQPTLGTNLTVAVASHSRKGVSR